MTVLSRILSLFPALVMGLAIACILWICQSPSLWNGLALLFVVYGLPLLTYRLHCRFYPIPLGVSFLSDPGYSPWWGSYQIQLIYNMFPALEKMLHFVPGLFSQWLRGWGAQVGKGVYWTPSVSILDRGLLKVGDGAVFGHLAITCSHAIKPRKGDRLMLYVQPVTVGDRAFIGAEANLGAGSTVQPGAMVAYRQTVGVGEVFPHPEPTAAKSPAPVTPETPTPEAPMDGSASP